MKNNSLHSSSINADISTVKNSFVQPNLPNSFSRFSTQTNDQFLRHLRQYWSNLSSARPTDTQFDKLNREIHYHISIESHIRGMSFDEIDLVWKMFINIFEISKDSSALTRVSDETFFFKCRYDGSHFELKIHLKSFFQIDNLKVKKFLDENRENNHLYKRAFVLADAVKNVLEFPDVKDKNLRNVPVSNSVHVLFMCAACTELFTQYIV